MLWMLLLALCTQGGLINKNLELCSKTSLWLKRHAQFLCKNHPGSWVPAAHNYTLCQLPSVSLKHNFSNPSCYHSPNHLCKIKFSSQIHQTYVICTSAHIYCLSSFHISHSTFIGGVGSFPGLNSGFHTCKSGATPLSCLCCPLPLSNNLGLADRNEQSYFIAKGLQRWCHFSLDIFFSSSLSSHRH